MTSIKYIKNHGVVPYLQDPNDGSIIDRIDINRIYFKGGNSYLVHQGVPILIDQNDSLFSVDEIVQKKPTTQDYEYSSNLHLKNYIRRNILPALSVDWMREIRYVRLAKIISEGSVLSIGSGNKSKYYRSCFSNSDVITSDVHLQFDVDVVFDAHKILFQDSTFTLSLASWVLEHVAKPWVVASEMQRVTKEGGCIQVEVPFVFPFHAAPYDFYRFTLTALRFLFFKSEMIMLETTEGAWSGAAVVMSQALIDSFSNKYLRMAALASGKLSFWWMKYLDKFNRKKHLNMPMGFAATFRKDGCHRKDKEMIE